MSRHYYLGTHDPNFTEQHDSLESAREAADGYCQEYGLNSCLIGVEDYCYPKIDAEHILNNHADDMHEGFLGIFDHLSKDRMDSLETDLNTAFRKFIFQNNLHYYFKYVRVIERYERK